jgi:hypothetical protein
MASGFEISVDSGAWIDVGLPYDTSSTFRFEWLNLAPGSHSYRVREYDASGNRSDPSAAFSFTIAAFDPPQIVGTGDSMMWGSGRDGEDPATTNPSYVTWQNLGGATWGDHTNVAFPGSSFANVSPTSNLFLIAVNDADPLFDAARLYNLLLANGGINNVTFVGGTIAASYPYLLARLKTFWIEFGLARRAVGWGPNGQGCIPEQMPPCDFPNTPTDYKTFLQVPFNDWLDANFYKYFADVCDYRHDADIGEDASTNTAYFDLADPDSGGTVDRLHRSALGSARLATYYQAAVLRCTTDITLPAAPTGFSVTSLNCEQIRVNYTASSGDNLHHYEIRINGGAFTNEIVDIGRDNPYYIKNLVGSTLYSVNIRTVDKAGHHSPWTTSVSATTTAGTFVLLHAIDCGRTSGGTVSGLEQDAFFTNGVPLTFAQSPYTALTFLIDDPVDNQGYQKARISDSISPVTYTFPDAHPTHHHRVRMHFVSAQIGHDDAPAPNTWKMDVIVNSVTIKNDWDLDLEVGVGTVVYVVEAEVAAGATSIVVEVPRFDGSTTAQIAVVELYGVAYTPPPPPSSSKIDVGRTTGGVVSGWDDEVTTGTSVSGGTAYNQAADTPDTTGETSPAPEAVYRNCRYELGSGQITAVISGLTPSTTYNFRTHHWSSNGNITGSLTMKCTANSVEKFNAAMSFALNGVYIQSFTCAADGSGEVTLVFEKVTTGAVVCGIEWT